MKMNVMHALTRPRPTIRHQPKALLFESLVAGELSAHAQKMTHEAQILVGDVEQGGNVLVRNNQKVNRRLRVDILEGGHEVIAIDDLSLDLPADDTTEKTFSH